MRVILSDQENTSENSEGLDSNWVNGDGCADLDLHLSVYFPELLPCLSSCSRTLCSGEPSFEMPVQPALLASACTRKTCICLGVMQLHFLTAFVFHRYRDKDFHKAPMKHNQSESAIAGGGSSAAKDDQSTSGSDSES